MKKEIELNDKITILLLVLIILLQVITRVYFGTQKSYLHIDEGYSYGLINYDKIDISGNEDFYNTWHNKEYFQDYLTINQEQAWDFSPVYENQKKDVHPPLYYLLLRILSSFTVDSFSMWTGLILNMIIFIGSSVLIFLIAKKVVKSNIYALLICFISGFTLAALATTMLIRMYELSGFFLLLITYLHLKIEGKQELGVKDLIPLCITIVASSLTHYYSLIFLFGLYVMFMVKYMTQKRWKNAISYTLCMVIAAVISLVIFPYSVQHMFFGYRGQGAISNVTDPTKLANNIVYFFAVLNNATFNGVLIPIVLLLFLLLAVIIVKKKKLVLEFSGKKIWYIVFPTLLYYFFIAGVSPYQEIRYIAPICAFLILMLICLYKHVLEVLVSKKTALILQIILLALFAIAPVVMKTDVEYVYTYRKPIVEKLEGEYNLPTLYVFNRGQNRFMDDIYLFCKIEESYILDSETFSKEKITEIMKGKDIDQGIILFMNGGMENDSYIAQILEAIGKSNVEYMHRLNACDVYYLY